MNTKDKIFIAGHTGLVGSAILKSLRNKGYSNFILKDSEALNLINQNAVDNFFRFEKPDYVFLAAAKVGGIMANNTLRAQFIYENLMIQNNVIHHSWKYGVKKLLFLGSTCIYPKNSIQPISEDCLLTSPLEYTNEPYAIAKISGIKMCESYNIQYGTNFISVMPTNLYGPNDNFNLATSHVLPALIRKMFIGKCLENDDWKSLKADLIKRPIEYLNENSSKEEIIAILKKNGISLVDNNITVEIWGSGQPLREFLWSEEMADACIYIMENINFCDLSYGEKIINTHINIGTGKEISIKNLALLIKNIIGFNGDIVFDNSKPDGTLRKLTDPTKINNLGWHHKIELDKGIEKLYNWYISSIN